MLSNMNIGTRLVVSYLIMALIVCVTGMLAITYVSSVGAEGVSIGEEQAPLSDAAMEVKLNAAEAHLKFEEIISGDATENIDQEVYRRLDRSIWYCNAIMSGGRNEEGTFIGTTNPAVHAKAGQVKSALEHFKKTAAERYAKKGQDVGPGSEADAAFDREFDDFVK